MEFKIPQPNENSMMRERSRPWQVAMVIMSTTCALLPCRPSLADQHPTTSVKSTGKRPNIVVIMADDMGYSDLGCFGGELRTPNLDQLAGNGLRFTNFYSENMCWVSRASLLTGVYHRTSMVDSGLHPRCVTLPEVLGRHGYQTRMSGKWHLAGKRSSTYPMDRGFQDFYGILGGAASFFAPHSLSRNHQNVEHEALENPDYYFTNAISDEAVRMVDAAKPAKPLLLYVAYMAAHWPLHAPEKDIAEYRGHFSKGWDALRSARMARMKELGILPQDTPLSPRHRIVPAWEDTPDRDWQKRRMEVYAAQVTMMDRGIGRIVDALRSSGRLDNTLLFFTIDNGGCHVEYGKERKGSFLPEKTRDGRKMRPGNLPDIMPGPEDTYQSYGHGWANLSNTPYRLFKQYDHEGGIRTPMIAHWPAGIKNEGRLVTSVNHLIDIMPTVLEVTDSTPPDSLDGKPTVSRDGQSLAAAFGDASYAGHETLFFHHNKGRAIRHEGWKLVAQSNAGKKSKGKIAWELYNLKDDPLELEDLAESMPQKVAQLKTLWKSESDRLEEQAAKR
jgi:arylsulfatase A-like enzyme